MRSRHQVREPHAAHFITSSIVAWLPVFTSARCCAILLGSFAYCREHKGLRIHGWVILDNHFHAIVAGLQLSQTVSDLKKFTARRILAQLPLEGRDWLRNQLAYFRAAHKRAREYQVWQEGFHPQAIMTEEMMLQKLEYIDNNPVRRDWVASPEHWRYGSAHERLGGAVTSLRCDPWR